MNKENRQIILLAMGIVLMIVALFLHKFFNAPDFFQGVVYGIGLGLVLLFIRKKRKQEI